MDQLFRTINDPLLSSYIRALVYETRSALFAFLKRRSMVNNALRLKDYLYTPSERGYHPTSFHSALSWGNVLRLRYKVLLVQDEGQGAFSNDRIVNFMVNYEQSRQSAYASSFSMCISNEVHSLRSMHF